MVRVLLMTALLLAPAAGHAQALLYRQGEPIPVPGVHGQFYARLPDGSIGMMPLQRTDNGKLLYRQGLPIPVPGSPGYFYAQMPDGSIGMTRLQGP